MSKIHKITQIESFAQQTMDSISILDLKLAHDYKHVDRVRGWAVQIAQGEGYDDIDRVQAAALLHDVGLAHTDRRSNHAQVGAEVAAQVRDWTVQLYQEAAKHAATCGLILADTKFEFGLTDDGIIWIDEALSPDSSRYWEAKDWSPGGPQPSFDKQYVRDYLESINWNKQPPGPTLSEDVITNTRAKYVEAYERITGRKFSVSC